MSEAEASAGQEGLSAAALRAQKRQARIKANAGQRITSITSNSREGGSSYLKNDTPFDAKATQESATQSSPVTGSTIASAPAAQPSSSARPTTAKAADPDDVDLALLSSDDPASTGLPRPGATGPNGEPDLMALLAQMTGQAPPDGTQAEGNDPLAQMMAALGNMQGGQGSMAGEQQTSHRPPPTLLQRGLPLLHLITMIVLAGWIYVKAQASNMDWSVLVHGTQAGDPSRDAQSWSVERMGVPHVPVLVAFVTVEVVLQSIRALVASNSAAPAGLLGNILPFLPHPFGLYARAALKYWAFVGQLLDDFAVLLFSLGAISIFHMSRAQEQLGGGLGAGKDEL